MVPVEWSDDDKYRRTYAIDRHSRSAGTYLETQRWGFAAVVLGFTGKTVLRQYTDVTDSAFEDWSLIAPGFLSSADQFETTRKRSLSAVEDASSIITKRSPS